MSRLLYDRVKNFKIPETGLIIKSVCYSTPYMGSGECWRTQAFIGEKNKFDWALDNQIPLVNGLELQLLTLGEKKFTDNPEIPFLVELNEKNKGEIMKNGVIDNGDYITYENRLKILRTIPIQLNDPKGIKSIGECKQELLIGCVPCVNLPDGSLFKVVGYKTE